MERILVYKYYGRRVEVGSVGGDAGGDAMMVMLVSMVGVLAVTIIVKIVMMEILGDGSDRCGRRWG